MRRGGFVSAAIEALAPSLCPHCHTGLAGCETGLCTQCWSQIIPLGGYRCPRCASPADDHEELCVRCLDTPPPQAETVVWGEYSGTLRRTLLAIKYGGHDELAPGLGHRLASRIAIRDWAADIDGVTHIPSHFVHRLRRGWAAAALIARAVADSLGLPLVSSLSRRGLHRQAGKSRAQRLRMSHSTFQPRRNLEGRQLLIVDDILTTGRTLHLAATALAKSTRKPVYCATLAWTPGPRRTHEFI